jgi:hypothetical protein
MTIFALNLRMNYLNQILNGLGTLRELRLQAGHEFRGPVDTAKEPKGPTILNDTFQIIGFKRKAGCTSTGCTSVSCTHQVRSSHRVPAMQ